MPEWDDIFPYTRPLFDPPQNFYVDASAGNIQFARTWFAFGQHTHTAGATEHTVWAADARWARMNTAQTVDLVSTSTDDAYGGTGATVVMIYGLLADFTEALEPVVMNGTTPVTSVNEYTCVTRIGVWEAGSGHTNAGDITCTASTDSTTQCFILAETSSSNGLVYAVPKDNKAMILAYSFTATSTVPCTARVHIYLHRPSGVIVKLPLPLMQVSGTMPSVFELRQEFTKFMEAGTVFEVTVTSTDDIELTGYINWVVTSKRVDEIII